MKKDPELMEELVTLIDDFYFANGRAPSVSEIAETLGKSKSVIQNYLVDMNGKGLLYYSNGMLRTRRMSNTSPGICFVPILSSIQCGEPQTEDIVYDEYIPLPTRIFGRGNYYALFARGLSMINAGIEPGDLIIVDRDREPREGDIVVALLDSENTLKTLKFDGDGIPYLHPENPDFGDIYPGEYGTLFIQGVMKYIIKNIEGFTN